MDKTKQEHINGLSQKLFNKPAKDINYLMVTNFIHKSLLEENLNRTGLYNWIQTFNGKISKPGDVKDYNDFDIIHINMSKQDRYLPAQIRKSLNKDSKTVIVINNDYTSELWEGVMEHPDSQCKFYEDADIVFGTEYFQSVALSEILNDKVYILPHPANIERLKSKRTTEKKPYIAVVWRRYDKFAYVPFLAARELGLQTVLVGYDRGQDPQWHLTESMYDHVIYHTDYDNYLKVLNDALFVYNPYTLHSYDRLGVDVAGMGCVAIGSNRTWAMKMCYPETICDVYDVRTTKEIFKKLLSDKEFYNRVSEYASEKSEYFNQENAKLRLLNSIVDRKEGLQCKGVIEYADTFGELETKPTTKECVEVSSSIGKSTGKIFKPEGIHIKKPDAFKYDEYSFENFLEAANDESWTCNVCNETMPTKEHYCRCNRTNIKQEE